MRHNSYLCCSACVHKIGKDIVFHTAGQKIYFTTPKAIKINLQITGYRSSRTNRVEMVYVKEGCRAFD